MTDVLVDLMALLLDLANIVGGLLLAGALVTHVPVTAGPPGAAGAAGTPGAPGRTGRAGVARFAGVAARGAARAVELLARAVPVVGIVALVSGGYWLLVHVTTGPHLFHFEIVGIGVGVALLWDRLTGRPATWLDRDGAPSGARLVLGVVGLIAVVVGLQGLATPNG